MDYEVESAIADLDQAIGLLRHVSGVLKDGRRKLVGTEKAALASAFALVSQLDANQAMAMMSVGLTEQAMESLSAMHDRLLFLDTQG